MVSIPVANDVIALTMTGFSSRVDTITMLEILDYGPINQPDIMFDFMGFGHRPDIRPRYSTLSASHRCGRPPCIWLPMAWDCRLTG